MAPYARVPAVRAWDRGRRSLTFEVPHQCCDLLNMVDLVVDTDRPIDTFIRSVRTTSGDWPIDELPAERALETLIAATGALLGRPERRVRALHGKTYIPLALAPFHEREVAVVSAARVTPITVRVELREGCEDAADLEWDMFGRLHYLDTPEESRALAEAPHEHIILQHQLCRTQRLRRGVNSLPLNAAFPVRCLLAWGFDRASVTRVRLLLSGKVWYDGGIGPLEHLQATYGHGDVEPLVIYLGNGSLVGPCPSAVDFTMVDEPVLEITTGTSRRCTCSSSGT